MNRSGRGTVEGVLAKTARWDLVRGEAFSFLRALPDRVVDAVVTDPPYSSGGMMRSDRNKLTSEKYVQGGTKTQRAEFSGDNRDQRSFLAWCALWMGECLRVVRPGGILMTFTDWRQLPTMTDAVQAGGWVWRGIVPWNKVHARPDLGRFTNQCEYVVWATMGPADQGKVGDGMIPGFYEVPGAFEAPVLPSDKHHMTGKPTALMVALARIFRPDSLVLDPFAGSATTGVGALRTGHRFVGVEVDGPNYAVAESRLHRWHLDDREYRELEKTMAKRRAPR